MKALRSVTPKKMWSGRQPCVAHMRVFGSLAYAMVSDEKKGEFNAKGAKCIFLGYCKCTKAHRLICLKTKKIIKNRNIVFVKDNGSI
jgi:hypothetical protein